MSAPNAKKKTKATQTNPVEDKFAEISRLTGNLAHEINTPLATILFLAENMQEELKNNKENLDQEELATASQQIINTVQTISEIIKSIRSYSKMDFKKPFLKTSFKDILDETMSYVQEMMQFEQVKLNMTPVDTDLAIHCRKSEIIQVLVNLIRNGIGAVAELDEQWVQLEVKKHDDHILISVVDSGIPPAKEVADKLFEPFYTTKKKSGGSGLGLAICKAIVESHGGEIAMNTSFKNTQFDVKLPLRPNNLFSN